MITIYPPLGVEVVWVLAQVTTPKLLTKITNRVESWLGTTNEVPK
jgi:hypothetical protein